jgi:hypothetical protein
MEHDNKMALANISYQTEIMKLSESSKQSLESIKAQLAGTSMKLNVQQKLSGIDLSNRQNQDAVDKEHNNNSQAANLAHAKETQAANHRHEANMSALSAPTEPAGRAQDGSAWSQ